MTLTILTLDVVPDHEDEHRDTPSFKVPLSKSKLSPRSQPASSRHSRKNSLGNQLSQDSKLQKLSPSPCATPHKSKKEQPKFQKPVIPEIESPPKFSLPSVASRQPLAHIDINGIGPSDLKRILEDPKNTSYLDTGLRVPSAPESSLLSSSHEAGSSSPLSSLSDLSDEETLEISTYGSQTIRDFEARKVMPAPATCPVCKVAVDREFLEEFNHGNPLRTRQQTQFCKAHTLRTAEQEWMERGYPKIDWGHFHKRLETFHPVMEDLLLGKKTSFYRNAFEDRVNKGQVRSLKSILNVETGMEDVIPGYYGSRGARVMYVQSFLSRHNEQYSPVNKIKLRNLQC